MRAIKIGATALLALGLLGPNAVADDFPSFSEPAPAKKARPAAKTASAVDVKRVSDLLERLGVKEQLAQFPALIDAGHTADEQRNVAAGLPSAAALRPAVIKAFTPDKVFANLAAHSAKTLSVEDQKAALAFAETPTGGKLIELSKQIATVEGLKELEAFAAANANGQPTWTNQIPLYYEIGEATGQSRLMASMGANASFSMAKGLISVGAMPAANRKVFQENFKKTYDALLKQNKVNILIVLAFIGQKTSEAEMREWLAFAKSPSGQRFYESINASFEHALGLAFQEYGPALVSTIKATKKG